MGYEAVICNNNPETVSTDFDTGDRLYFDPLTKEDVANIIQTEQPYGVVVQFGGQTAIKLTRYLADMGVHILGTSADDIDAAEDRERFDELLERCGIPRPAGETVMNTKEALKAANDLGYPVLLRPSYVLGGQNMIIAHSDKDVVEYMGIIMSHMIENPVLIDKYMMGTEVEVDAICDGTDFLIPGIMEHVERAGVHSGDSISIYPAQNLSEKVTETIVRYTGLLAKELHAVGLINIQYVVYNHEVYVIEVNPRSSRTVPYISKVTGIPMVDLATKIMLGETLKSLGYHSGLYPSGKYVAVKVPVFSFEKLQDVDTMLGPEMKSTGECLGIATTFEDALLVGLMLITLLKHADRVKIACMAQLVNVIAPIMTDQGGGAAWKQTIFYPFLHASRYGRGVALMPLVQTAKHDTAKHENVTDVESVAVYNEEKEELTIFAVNRTLDEDIELTTDLRGMEGFHLTEHIVMEESNLKLVNSSYEQKVVPKTVNRSKMDGGIMTTLLGKASWNVIRLSK